MKCEYYSPETGWNSLTLDFTREWFDERGFVEFAGLSIEDFDDDYVYFAPTTNKAECLRRVLKSELEAEKNKIETKTIKLIDKIDLLYEDEEGNKYILL